MAKLYGIGVGPGDSELLTVKAVRILKKCSVVVVPSPRPKGDSAALSIAKEYINEAAEVIIKYFPMSKNKEEDIKEAFKCIEEKLKSGKDVAFLTIGDPFIYSTYIYLLQYINKKGYSTETVPGIPSFCAAASLTGEPLVIGNESLLIIPASELNKIRDNKNVVIMKFYKQRKEVLDFLELNKFDYTCVKRAGREGENILKNREDILEESDYMSLIIAHRV
ncbi:MAG: cobalt-factor II C(20)-methyltransferase [Clostridium sp.]|nr:cobalt-factor II C(20)-methyltransferase [Clostridium sp.]